jgi:hypothetical protein
VLKWLDVNWQSFAYMCKEARLSILIYNNNLDRPQLLLNNQNSILIEKPLICTHLLMQEEFDDTKGVSRILKSKKDIQQHGQKKKDKRTNNDLQNIHIKLKIK